MAGEIKNLGGLTASTLEGSGIEAGGVNNLVAKMDENKDYLEKAAYILSDKIPAAVKITSEGGKTFFAVGEKNEGDHKDLEVKLVRLPNGETVKLDEPITISFDKETDKSKGLVAGAISDGSLEQLKQQFGLKDKSVNVGAGTVGTPEQIAEAIDKGIILGGDDGGRIISNQLKDEKSQLFKACIESHQDKKTKDPMGDCIGLLETPATPAVAKANIKAHR